MSTAATAAAGNSEDMGVVVKAAGSTAVCASAIATTWLESVAGIAVVPAAVRSAFIACPYRSFAAVIFQPGN